MRRCAFCGSALPNNARFCGRCGQASLSELSLLATQPKRGQGANVYMMQGMPQANGVPKGQATAQANGASKGQGQATAQANGVSKRKGTPSTSSARKAMGSLPPPRPLYSSDDQDLRDVGPAPSYTPIPYYHWYRQRRPKIPAARWLAIVFTALLITASIIGGLNFLSPPTIWLSGSGVVAQGDLLHLHGMGFFAGNSVTLMLDGHLPLSPVVHISSSSHKAIQISRSGTFDVTVAVSRSWSFGAHSIRATESIGSRNAEVSFTIVALPGKLTVSPSSLYLGMLQEGSQVTQTLAISNVGQQPLHWAADAGTANWLTLDIQAGTLRPGTFQIIQVMADTTSLTAGIYSDTLAISAGSERMQVRVTLVVAALPKPTSSPTPTPTSTQSTSPSPSPQAPPPPQALPPPPQAPPRHNPTPRPTPLPTTMPNRHVVHGGGGGG